MRYVTEQLGLNPTVLDVNMIQSFEIVKLHVKLQSSLASSVSPPDAASPQQNSAPSIRRAAKARCVE